jgi:tetraacyldisaccharide 4'-kinase
MRAPRFWSQTPPHLAARLLAPLGGVVGRETLRRMARPGADIAVPVICVGNPVAGGAGKTPTAIAVSRILHQMAERPVFLSRGHGGLLKGPVLVDPDTHGAADVGDEPLLLTRAAPTIVSRDRLSGARVAERLDTVIIMDDGFQNPALRKDLSILVVDAAVGTGNGLCLPAGPLRAPLMEQLRQAGAVVLIGQGSAGEAVRGRAQSIGLPVFAAKLHPIQDGAHPLAGRRVLAFAGIGRPAKFAETLQELGAKIAGFVPLPDHHVFRERDALELLTRADRERLLLVTTEKDHARLAGAQSSALRELASLARVVPVSLRFEDEAGVQALLHHALENRRARSTSG